MAINYKQYDAEKNSDGKAIEDVLFGIRYNNHPDRLLFFDGGEMIQRGEYENDMVKYYLCHPVSDMTTGWLAFRQLRAYKDNKNYLSADECKTWSDILFSALYLFEGKTDEELREYGRRQIRAQYYKLYNGLKQNGGEIKIAEDGDGKTDDEFVAEMMKAPKVIEAVDEFVVYGRRVVADVADMLAKIREYRADTDFAKYCDALQLFNPYFRITAENMPNYTDVPLNHLCPVAEWREMPQPAKQTTAVVETIAEEDKAVCDLIESSTTYVANNILNDMFATRERLEKVFGDLSPKNAAAVGCIENAANYTADKTFAMYCKRAFLLIVNRYNDILKTNAVDVLAIRSKEAAQRYNTFAISHREFCEGVFRREWHKLTKEQRLTFNEEKPTTADNVLNHITQKYFITGLPFAFQDEDKPKATAFKYIHITQPDDGNGQFVCQFSHIACYLFGGYTALPRDYEKLYTGRQMTISAQILPILIAQHRNQGYKLTAPKNELMQSLQTDPQHGNEVLNTIVDGWFDWLGTTMEKDGDNITIRAKKGNEFFNPINHAQMTTKEQPTKRGRPKGSKDKKKRSRRPNGK